MREQSFIDPDGDVREQIRLYLKKFGISYTKVAEEIDSSPSHVMRMLNLNRPMKKEYIDRLNDFLGTNFKTTEDGAIEQES